jgi:hypothetical protein
MKHVLHITLALLSALALSLTASAQTPPERVYVSSVSPASDTSGSGTLSAPYRTIKKAVDEVAAGGEVIVLDSGEYQHATSEISITKSVSIFAPVGVNATVKVTSSTQNAITVNAGSSDKVFLRGLTLFTASAGHTGIKATAVGTLQVENCVIGGFIYSGIDVETAADSKLFVRDSEIRGQTTTGKGIDLSTTSGTVKAYVDRTRLEKNTLAGVYLGENVQASIRDSLITGSDVGLHVNAASGASQLNVEGCQVTANATGVKSEGAVATARVSNSTITRNDTGWTTASAGTLLTRSNNTLTANVSNGSTSGTYSAY